MAVRITAGVGGLLLLLGLGILVFFKSGTAWRKSGERIDVAEGELRELLAVERYFAPRLSLQTEHLPCTVASIHSAWACAPLPAPGTAAFVRTAARVRELRAVESVHAAHLAAQSLLLLGDPRAAGAQLAESLRLEPLDEEIRADAIAAQLLLFESDGDAIWLWDALQAHADFYPQRSTSLPLLFNWALLLERGGLSSEALATWERYLMLETDPAWRREAQARSTRLRELSSRQAWDALRASLDAAHAPAGELPTELLQHVRLHLQDRLLDRWADLELAGATRAEERLPTLHQIARDLALAQSDHLLADSVGLLLPSPSRRRLAEAHRSYALGRQAHETHEYEVAAAHFERAEEGFSAAGSPFVIWPRIYLAIIVHHRPDFATAERQLLELRREPGLSRYPIAGGYIEWMLGLGAWRMADYHGAQRHFGAAREAFVGAGEIENAAAMDSELGGVVAETLPPEAAWRHHHAALARLPGVLKSRRKQNILAAAGEFLRRQGANGAAALYLDAVVREAEASGAPLSVALALLDRAELATSRGRLRAARADLERALGQARAIPDPGLRSDTELDLMLAQAETLESSQPRAALSLLTEVLILARERRADSRLVRAFAARAATFSRLEQVAAARADLLAALSEIELQRLRLDDPQQRREFVAQARDILGRLVRSEWSERRFRSALDAVERFRAGILSDSLGLSPAISTGAVAAIGDLPPSTVILTYLAVDDELFIWRASSRGVHGARVAVSETELERLVRQMRRFLQTAEVRGGAASARLGRLLLPQNALPVGTLRVVIIPDGPLHAVPFAALPTVGGPLLVEEASVVVSPSLRTFRHLSAKRQAREGVDLLVVSGVEHDPTEYPELQRLPDRWAERQLSGWRRVRTLGGARATPGAVLAEARDATVLYFAGHAVSETPFQEGGLLLAPEADGDGLLGFEDLRNLEPSRLELAILAACGTGTGRSSALDGPRSLVEPFLAAGVTSVVGTLWEVDDLAAAEFFEAFLDLRDQPDPVRAAQLRLLRRRPGDTTWAAFQQFGAGWPANDLAVVDREY